MVMILIAASITPELQVILPLDIEHKISTGKRNMKRFGVSIREFEWHYEVLERLDAARRGDCIKLTI